jgi:hypothetical protein
MKCPKCDFNGNDEEVISHHTKVHIKGIKYECQKCGKNKNKRFDSTRGYVEHMRKIHNTKPNDLEDRVVEQFKLEARKDSIKAPHVPENPDSPKKFECNNCGKNFTRYPKNSGGKYPKFCSPECHLSSDGHSNRFSGEDNPNYVDGESRNRDYGNRWKEIRSKVKERDFNRCRICRVTESECREKYNCDLHIHHKIPLVKFDNIGKANTLYNLITVCPKCHGKLEKELNK